MKLLRYGPCGAEKPGILDHDGQVRDLSSLTKDIGSSSLADGLLAQLREVDVSRLPVVKEPGRIGSCVSRPGKFVCIGLNYADHAAETGAAIPSEPVVFMKATTALSGPNDPIIKPRGSTQLDWEVELALVVGQRCAYADEAEARAAIAGYCLCNDVSERAFQLQSQQWDKGKGCDSFGPIGPWLVTPDEIENIDNLSMWLDVNGVRMQEGSTSTMIFRPAFILSYLSRFMTLEPGDVITTGTPPGVGMGKKPQMWLKVGDQVTLGIDGLGEQHQTVIQA